MAKKYLVKIPSCINGNLTTLQSKNSILTSVKIDSLAYKEALKEKKLAKQRVLENKNH